MRKRIPHYLIALFLISGLALGANLRDHAGGSHPIAGDDVIADFSEAIASEAEELSFDPATVMGAASESSVYDQVFPYYAEVCSVTQIHRRGEEPGGAPGHALVYLKGLCRDPDAPFPRVRVCDEGEKDLSDPESGMAISVNKIFKNVNWVAIEGRTRVFRGALGPDEAVTAESHERSIQQIVQSGAYNGIRADSAYMAQKPEGRSDVEHIAREGAGTDFGILFGRNAYCARVPLTRGMTEDAVRYLNRLNDRYFTGAAGEYVWNEYKDNCTHVVHNVFAAAGLRDFKATNQPMLLQIFHLAMPSHEVIRAATLGNSELPDIRKAWKDDRLRRMLLEHHHLPGAGGGLVRYHSQLLEGNELYRPSEKFMIVNIPLVSERKVQLKRFITEERYTDLDTQLEAARTRIEDRALDLPLLSHLEAESGKYRKPEFAHFYDRYREFLEQSLDRIVLGQELLEAAESD